MRDADARATAAMGRRAALLGTAMVATAVIGGLARERAARGRTAEPPHLDANIPTSFGPWQELAAAPQIVNPQTQQMLDSLYSEVVARTYVGPQRYHVMLSAAYGNDQRGGLAAHRPEVCYPAQGFVLHEQFDARLDTPHGAIHLRRLRTALGARIEPVSYWFAMTDTTRATAFDKRLALIRATLTGNVPDGMLVRVSSIDPDPARAWLRHDEFVVDLLQALPAATRDRLLGRTAA